MTDQASTAAPADAAPKGLLARVTGVFFSPRATYAAVAARPRALGVLAVTCLVIGSGFFAFLSSDTGKQALFDQQTQTIESFGVKLNDAAYERMQAGIDRARITTPIAQVVVIPAMLAIIAGIMLGVFNALLGGDASYRQVFAVLAHSSLIGALGTLFSLPLDYVRETMSSPTSLLALLPFLDDSSFLGRLFSMIDLFQVWAFVSMAIGLGVLYKRRTTPIAVSIFAVYVVIIAAVAAVRTALSS
jgi:hypothetical protein